MGGVGTRSRTVVLAAAALAVAAWRPTPAAELGVGSRAPVIDIEHWFEDAAGSKPIEAFEPGRVYVVEFWATWCPPCRDSIPHLAAVQERFAGKGVTVIGVSDEDVDTIETFLAEKSGDGTFGDLTRKYRLATDPDGSVNAGYMEAAGQNGIPTAFIVGRKGEIEWIGHPLEMDEPLEQVVAGTWDRAAHAAAMREQAEIEARFAEISALVGEGKAAAAVDVLDEMIRGVKDAELKGRLASIRAQLAIRAGGPRAVEAFAVACAQAGNSAEELNELAWAVATLAEEGESPAPELLAAALAAAQKAATLAPEEGAVLDTLAHLLALKGDVAAALATQRKAAAHAGDQADQINAFLRELEQRAAGK